MANYPGSQMRRMNHECMIKIVNVVVMPPAVEIEIQSSPPSMITILFEYHTILS